MSLFTRKAVDEIRRVLHRLDEDIERARKALAAGDVGGGQAELSDAVNAKYEALYFFPDVIVNERETIPFIRLFALFESIGRLIVITRAWPSLAPYGEPDTIDELIRRLEEKLDEVQKLRAKAWMEGGRCHARHLLGGYCRRVVDKAASKARGGTIEMSRKEPSAKRWRSPLTM